MCHTIPYCTRKYHHIHVPPNPHDGDIVVKTNPLSDGPTIFYQDVIQTSFFRINKWEIAICCKRPRKRGRLLFLFFTVMFESTILPARARLGEVIWRKKLIIVQYFKNLLKEYNGGASWLLCIWSGSAVYLEQEFPDTFLPGINLHSSLEKTL